MGEFDRSDSYGWRANSMDRRTEVTKFRQILLHGGFSQEFVDNFKIILWDVPNTFYDSNPVAKFEALGDEPNVIHIGGLDGSIITFLLEGKVDQKIPTTTEELFKSVMDQELLSYVKV